MAVEAHHLLHHPGGQRLAATTARTGWEGGGGCYDAPTSTAAGGRHGCYYGGGDVAVAARQSHQLMQQQQSPGSLMMMATTGQQLCAADASESGVTFGGAQAQEAMVAAPCRKRKRAVAGEQQFLAAGVAAHLQQQQLVDVDRLVLQHTARMWAELTEQRRRHARQLAAAVEAAAVKRLRAKEEEMERMSRLNWALEDRVRSLLVEAQVWRDLAQSNEAAANALRAELQHALDAQQQQALPGAAADDAASRCCGENDVAAGTLGDEEVRSAAAPRRCAVCGEGRPEVLLLPCRHLCACAPCAAAATACPACGCAKNGTVRVNFS